MLTKERMLELAKRRVEEVQVKAWGGETVFMRGMTGADRNAFLIRVRDPRSEPGKYIINEATYAHELIARCLCDADGKRLFGEGETAQVGEFPPEVLDELMTVAQRLSGMDGDGEAEKN